MAANCRVKGQKGMTDQDMADMMRQLGLHMLMMPADPNPGETQVNDSDNVN